MSNWQIIKKNVFTLFNFLNALIALLLFLAGAYSNMLFITIVILNTVIGTAQELKAKAMVERLSLLNSPRCVLWKNGREREVSPEEVKEGGRAGLSERKPGIPRCEDPAGQPGGR